MPRRRGPRCLVLVLVGWGLLLGPAAGVLAGEMIPCLSQEAYVWQRLWTPPVRASVREHGAAFTALDVLACELSFEAGRPVLNLARPDWVTLVGTGRPIRLVVRSADRPVSAETGTGPAADAVIAACTGTLARARAAGVEPAELQLDLDAATSQLGVYRALVDRLRPSLGSTAFAITVLPDWMRSPDFGPLVRAAGAFILQVHSLERPRGRDQAFTLCDPDRALRWSRAAAAFGVPFRVALPAYGYRMAFGADGGFVGLEAEGPPREWPPGVEVRTVMAEPAAMAAVVRSLAKNPGNGCQGIVWFRLPADDDRLSWRWQTLAQVMAGTTPQGRLTLQVSAAGTNLVDLRMVNRSESHVFLGPIAVTWARSHLLAGEAMAGWSLMKTGPYAIALDPGKQKDGILFPGESRQIGWLRFDGPAQLASSIVPLEFLPELP